MIVEREDIKMEHKDEQRLKRKRELEAAERIEREEKKIASIYDSNVIINEIECQFEERKIGDTPCYIYMPTIFRQLTEAELSITFPGNNRPKYVFGHEDLLLTISVSMSQSPMPKSYIQQFLNVSDRIIKGMVPQAMVLKRYMMGNDDFPVGVAEFSSGGLSGTIFNYMLFSSVNEKLFIVNLYSSYAMHDDILPIMKQMTETYRIEEKENE